MSPAAPQPSTPAATVLLGLATAGARDALRATTMAMRLPPADLPPGPQSVRHLAEVLKAQPGSIAVLDLAVLPRTVPHVLALTAALPDPALRARVLLTRELSGVWPADQAWGLELGFAGLWGQLDPQALTGETHALVNRLGGLVGQPGLPPEALAQYFSAMQVKPDVGAPRGRIRRLTGLSAEALCLALASEVKAIDRSYRLTTYPSCHTGVEAVDWLSSRFRVTRERAVGLGQDLQALGLLQHVVHEQPFADLPNFYRITQSGAVDRWNPGAVYQLLRQPTGIEVKDRKYLGKTYDDCFVGAEAVTWVRDRLKLRRHEAEILLNRLLRFGLIAHVTNDHPLRDGNFFYRFVD